MIKRIGRNRQAVSALTNADIWRAVGKASAAVLGHVTPSGSPRTSAVVYRAVRRHLYVAVAPDSWKARHIASDSRVSMTVLVPRGGLLSLMFPIPPATITFHVRAQVHPADAPKVGQLLAELSSLLPPERATSSCLIEITPEGDFLTYGIGIPLLAMRTPARARARLPVG
jgi:Pyridoxamine 5'-phosphate oxidase